MPGRTRSNHRGPATRQRLIDAAIDIICTKGPAGLTTGNIAHGAGLQQSSFYAYFKNVEQCLKAIATDLTESLQHAELELRQANALLIGDRGRLEEGIEHMQRALCLWMQDRRLASLLRRCRYEDSALGESARDAVERSSAMLAEDLLEHAVRSGVSPRHLHDIQVIASLITGAFLQSLDLILSGTVRDMNMMAAVLARSHHHQVHAELARMRSEPPR